MAQLILSVLATILVCKGFMVLVKTSMRTRPAITAGWGMVTLGSFMMATAPLFAPAVIPIGAIYLTLAGEATLALSTRRAT